MNFNDFFQPPQPMIPELTNTQEAMNDVALRVQQIVVGMDVYKHQLDKVNDILPGMMAQGYATNDVPLWWGVSKNPETLSEGIHKSLTFTLLNAMNMHLYLIDEFMKSVAIKYYNYKPDDSSWFNPQVFMLLSGIDVSKIQYADDVDELRRTIDKLRQFKITRTTNANEYFDLYSKLNIFIAQLALCVNEHISKKSIGEGRNENDSK